MRQWGKKEGETEGDAAAAAGSGEGGKAEEDKKDKLPKRKVAALIGYNGIGYKGSQVFVQNLFFSSVSLVHADQVFVYSNPGQDTIEGEVFKALVKAGAISEDNSNNHQKVRIFLDSRFIGLHSRHLHSSRFRSLVLLVPMQACMQLSTSSPSNSFLLLPTCPQIRLSKTTSTLSSLPPSDCGRLPEFKVLSTPASFAINDSTNTLYRPTSSSDQNLPQRWARCSKEPERHRLLSKVLNLNLLSPHQSSKLRKSSGRVDQRRVDSQRM